MKVDVDRQIALWRNALREEGRLPEEDLQELEDHLRDGFDSLKALGLADDEALIIAMTNGRRTSLGSGDGPRR